MEKAEIRPDPDGHTDAGDGWPYRHAHDPQDGRRRTVPGLKYVKLPKQLGSAIIRQK